jgi:tRNA pseudouridine55 synthase
LEAERQRTLQVPPAVSAIKQNGKPAYDRHRRGEQVLLAERAVGVLEMQLISFSDASVELSLAVTKGYYVRSLARDIGEALGMPSHLAALCRTRSGCFTLNEAANWPCAVAPPCLSIADVARRCMLTRVVNAEGARRAQCGLLLHAEHWNEASGVCNPGHSSGVEMWLDESDNPVALGEPAEDGSWKVVRGFRPRVEAQ